MSYENYKADPNRQIGKIGAAASIFPYILLGMIIIVSVMLVLKKDRKNRR